MRYQKLPGNLWPMICLAKFFRAFVWGSDGANNVSRETSVQITRS